MYNPNQEANIPMALATLNHLGNDELKELLNDEDKFEDLVKDIKQFKDLETEKEVLMASNRSLAEFNLEQQPKLEEGKQTIHELGEKGAALCQSIQEKIDLLKEKSGSMSVESAFELLQASAAEMEEESEQIAEKFLTKENEVDEFLDQFLTRRKIMHLKKVKIDKMRELKRKLSMKSVNPSYPTTNNFPGMVPYPTGPLAMPMPGNFRIN